MPNPNRDGFPIRSTGTMDSPFFAITPTSRVLPLARIFPREPPDPVRIRRALALMAAAARGAHPKRQPLSVITTDDGCYQIVAGNSTFHALLELGEQEAVVEII
jgi:hypothetical protein